MSFEDLIAAEISGAEAESAAQERKPLLRDGLAVWVSRDGSRKHVREMSNQHLQNTIRVLLGNSPLGTKASTSVIQRKLEWLEVLREELAFRGLEEL